MSENNKIRKLSEDELEDVNGGVDGAQRGYQYFKANTATPFRSNPWWKDGNTISTVSAGERIYSEGITNPGTLENGESCLYINCKINATWGWIRADHLDSDEFIGYK